MSLRINIGNMTDTQHQPQNGKERKLFDPATIIQTLLFFAAGVPALFHLVEKVDATAEKSDNVAAQVKNLSDILIQHTTAIGETNTKLDAQATQFGNLSEEVKSLDGLKVSVGILLDRSNASNQRATPSSGGH